MYLIALGESKAYGNFIINNDIERYKKKFKKFTFYENK